MSAAAVIVEPRRTAAVWARRVCGVLVAAGCVTLAGGGLWFLAVPGVAAGAFALATFRRREPRSAAGRVEVSAAGVRVERGGDVSTHGWPTVAGWREDGGSLRVTLRGPARERPVVEVVFDGDAADRRLLREFTPRRGGAYGSS